MKGLLSGLSAWNDAALHETEISRRLLSSNASATFGSLFCILLGRLAAAPTVERPILLALRFSFTAIAAAYGFEICQQTMSVEEDTHNKPSRPIPAGLLDVNGASRRWALAWTLSPLILAAIGPLRTSAWLTCTFAWVYFCYVRPRPHHWLFKNLFTAVHQFLFVQMVDSLVMLHAPQSGAGMLLGAGSSAWILATIHLQDFHDIDGDRKMGRRTLPIILPKSTLILVKLVTAGFLVMFALIAAIVSRGNATGRMVDILAWLQFAGACTTALRLLRTESVTQAETTYKKFYVPTGLSLIVYLSLIDYLIEEYHFV